MKISTVVENNLCISCGICAGVCPKKCITSTLNAGSYQPTIDENSCVNCGLCHKVCPGKGADYTKTDAENIFVGKAIKCFVVQTKDRRILVKATSGGAVTTIVKGLLKDGLYDGAFLVDTYNHENETFTNLYTAESDFNNTPKSRYLTINQSRAIAYMLANPDKRLIFVGTPCFIQGLLNVIEQFKLNRDNYFLAGLFCDKTMNYNAWRYFNNLLKINKLYFRSKSSKGWPGEVGLESRGKRYFLPRELRMQMKDFFCVERCRYCLDKLSQFADISFGDNYTKTPLPRQMERKAGTSCIIIRTERGAEIFEKYKRLFLRHEIPAQAIYDTQKIDVRMKNFIFSEYKSAEVGYTINVVPSSVSFGVYEDANCRNQYDVLLSKQKMGREELFPKVAAGLWRSLMPPLRQLGMPQTS